MRTVLAGVVVTMLTGAGLLCSFPVAAHMDRIDKRANELALPDELLDPAWPELAPDSALTLPEDSVDDGLDDAEREDLERLRAIQGLDARSGTAPVGDEEGESLGDAPRDGLDDGFEPDPTEW